jgi:hypothetical protein
MIKRRRALYYFRGRCFLPYLDQFTEDQRELLTSLPYRTGVLIGESDSTGGDDANEAEMRALEAIVAGYVEDFCKSEFVEELMRGTLARRPKWDSWRENIDKVPDECRQAIDLLAERLDYKQLTAFKHNLLEIAMAVAMAYREFDPNGPLVERVRVYSDYYLQWVRAYIKKEKILGIEDALSISRAEQKVIMALKEALRPEQVEGIEPPVLEEDSAPIPKMGPPPDSLPPLPKKSETPAEGS